VGRTRDEPCWAAYRALAHRRLGQEGLRRLFEANEGQASELLDRMILLSGGQVRDLLRLLRETALRSMSLPALPATSYVVEQAIASVRSDFLPVALDDAKWLDFIARNRMTGLPNTEAIAVMRLARFLDNHSVLFFKNAQEWYDIHPLIPDEVAKVLTAAGAPPA
jgi:hypothetical protein